MTPALRRILCNALIDSKFDYTCSAWYPNLNEKKKKIQFAQNKCIERNGTKNRIERKTSCIQQRVSVN